MREDRDALRIGAGTRHYEILRDPLIARHCAVLAEAAAFIGDMQVRNRGTIGGSLAHADPAADYSPVLVAAGARVIVRSVRGEREIAADKFFTNLMETALKPDEIVTEVLVPKLGAARGAYTRLHRVEGNFAIVNAAAILSDKHARIALGGVGSTPVALDVSAELSRGLNADALEAVGRRVRAACTDAPADLNASADYRRQMAAVYAERALAVAAGRTPSQQTPEAGRKPAPAASAPRKTADRRDRRSAPHRDRGFGKRAGAAARGRQPDGAGRPAARGDWADRHAHRLRHRKLRRVHRDARRAHGQRVARCWPRTSTDARSRRSNRWPPTSIICIRCRSPSCAITASNAATARPGW